MNRYRWSSHRVYAGLARRPSWLSGQRLAYWGRGPAAHAAYRRQIAQAFGKPADNPWDTLRSGLVLGSEQLWRRVKQISSGKSGQDERRWQQREDGRACGSEANGAWMWPARAVIATAAA